MTREFKARLMCNGSIDTKKYRYIYRVYADRAEIRRLPIEYLDTTAAIDGWETIEVISE